MERENRKIKICKKDKDNRKGKRNVHSRGSEKYKNGLETIARFRLGSETRVSKYKKKEEEHNCRMFGKENENIEHVY